MPSFPAIFFSRPIRTLLPALALAVGCLTAYAQQGNAYDQVLQLQHSQPQEALQMAEKYIHAHPHDPQMRFIMANMLLQAGNQDEAQTMIVQLTRDYPELAEPWNNLAVIQAGEGRLQEARQALQTALNLDPTYAMAQENLGDVYLQLALQSWRQAAAQDPDNRLLKAKIQFLQSSENVDEGLASDNPGRLYSH